MPEIFIGTSGWNYKEWKDGFYQGVAQKRWLEHYAGRFTAVEVNATFYRLLKEKTVSQWVERTPAGFAFTVKGSRYITHTKRLKEPESSIRTQRHNLAPMQAKLHAVCWQLPATMTKDMDRLQGFTSALRSWPEVRHALEFRHTSWFDQEVADCLAGSGLAVCISDAADWPRWDQVSTDLVYIRLHGNEETYSSMYSQAELRNWAEYIRTCREQGCTVHIYFDNTAHGAAVHNAAELQTLVSEL